MKVTPERRADRANRAAIDAARKAGRVPPELEATPAWRAVCRARKLRAHCLQLIAGWHSPDPEAWPRALAAAEAAAAAYVPQPRRGRALDAAETKGKT